MKIVAGNLTHGMNSAPKLVAVIGGSGSGKTWLADQLRTRIGKEAGRVSLDNFYSDRSHLPPARRARINFDHPRAIDWTLFEATLSRVRNGDLLRIPQYDFATHTRLQEWEVYKPRAVLLVDGLWLLHRRPIRQMFSFTIFLDCSASLRLQRRIQRDLLERARSEESVRQQFARCVAPMHDRYVAPQKERADLVISNVPSAKQIDALAEQIRRRLAEHP
jgi:uridine kinase